MAYSEPIVETWALYGAGSLLIFLRLLCRWRMVGFRGFDPDDYLVVFSWTVYTIMTYAADVCDRHADLHELPLAERLTMSAEEAKPYIYVRQWFAAGVATYVVFIWSLKLNMLFFFRRVVKGLWVDKYILPLMGVVGATFIIIMGIEFGSCRPYPRMWRFYSDEGPLCIPTATIYMLPTLIMNIITDMCIMAIPAPVVLPAKTSLMRKISLILLFSGGFFVMIASILRVTYVMVEQDGTTAAIWSCREDFVAIIVGQVPMVRPAFTRSFWSKANTQGTGTWGSSKGLSKPLSMPINSSSHDAFEMGKNRRKAQANNYCVTILSTRGPGNEDGDSTDRIIEGGITVDTFVDVESVCVDHGPNGMPDQAGRQVGSGYKPPFREPISRPGHIH